MKVTYVDHMGSDLSVVNAARVSFSKKSEGYVVKDHKLGTKELNEKDSGLISYLARHNHWTPFGHTSITLHLKTPIFVARQLGKHQVGMVWNEVSRRYVSDEPEIYWPSWRGQAENVKQGSGGDLDDETQQRIFHEVDRAAQAALNVYHNLVNVDKVAPELARMVLPQSMYTEWYWTGSLYGFANVYRLRSDPHSQKETQNIAHQISEIVQPLFPVSWENLTS